jgi:hypothetical protein
MKILVGVLITLCLIWCIHSAHAETTTINPYKDEGRNAFIAPKSNLNETTCRWEAPTPQPTASEGKNTTSWALNTRP